MCVRCFRATSGLAHVPPRVGRAAGCAWWPSAHIYIYIYIYTQYIKIYNCLTISQEINLARILTISHNFK